MRIERVLPTEELIRFEAIKHNQVRLTIENGKIIIQPCEKPRGRILKNTANIFVDAIPLIIQQGEAIISGEDNWIQIYSRMSVAIWFNKEGIEFKKMTNWKKPEPIFVMNTETYIGYNAITKALFGNNHNHILGVPTMLSDLLPEIDLGKLKWIKTIPANGRIKEHKVYEYEGKVYKGRTALRRAFPNLTDKELKEFNIEKAEPARERHEELIEKYEISKAGDWYTFPDCNMDTKAAVLRYLKENGESCSRETAKKMFEVLNYIED